MRNKRARRASVAEGSSRRVEPEPGHLTAGETPIEARAVILCQEVESSCSYCREGMFQKSSSDSLRSSVRGDYQPAHDPVDLAVANYLDRPGDLTFVQSDEGRDTGCRERARDRLGIVPEVPALGCAEARHRPSVVRAERLDLGHPLDSTPAATRTRSACGDVPLVCANVA